MIYEQSGPIEEISVEGFKVVSGDLFVHLPRKSGPTCTIWSNSINFSKTALVALNNCERIRIEVNPEKRCILIVPVTSKDKDGIRWVKNVKEPMTRKMECKQFTMQLFDTWGWRYDYVYRASGKLVSADKKVMLLFDFSEPENWKCKEKGKSNG